MKEVFGNIKSLNSINLTEIVLPKNTEFSCHLFLTVEAETIQILNVYK